MSRQFCYLLLSLSLISFAWPALGQRVNHQSSITTSSEQRVRCGRIGCMAVTPRPGCRTVLLGGIRVGNHHKVVCDKKS
jgi:hypothetical protein